MEREKQTKKNVFFFNNELRRKDWRRRKKLAPSQKINSFSLSILGEKEKRRNRDLKRGPSFGRLKKRSNQRQELFFLVL